MYAVCVRIDLKPGTLDQFLPLIQRNAWTSLTMEPGCHRFDVLTDSGTPDAVFLYELYANRAAFDLHLKSSHFLAFDAKVATMIADKDVQTWDQVTQ